MMSVAGTWWKQVLLWDVVDEKVGVFSSLFLLKRKRVLLAMSSVDKTAAALFVGCFVLSVTGIYVLFFVRFALF